MNTRKILTAMLLAVLITAAVGIVAADSEAEGASPRLTLTSAEYDKATDILTVSGTSTEKQLWFQITDSEGTLKVSSESIIVRNGSYTQDVFLDGYAEGTYTVSVYIEEGLVRTTESKTFEIATETTVMTITPDKTVLNIYEGDTGYVSFTLSGCTYDQVDVRISNSNIATAGSMTSDCKVQVRGVNSGEAKLLLVCGGTTAEVEIKVAERPPSTEVKTFSFMIKAEDDLDKCDLGSSGFGEDDLRSGIEFTGRGTNAGEALENGCDTLGIPASFWSGQDGPQDLRYWIESLAGLEQVDLHNDAWKYWVQYHNWNFNNLTLGYYEDASGVYQLVYKVSDMSGEDLDPEPEPGTKPGTDTNPDDDKPLIDEKTETETTDNDDGSTTTTTTTTGKTEDGKDVEIVENVTEKDGASTTNKTEIVKDKGGNEVGSKVTESTTDKDGNITSKTTATKTEEDGSKTSSTSESKLDKDGNGTTESKTVTTKADGSTVTKETSTEKSAEGTKETVTDKTVTEDKVQETKVTETKDAEGKTTGKQTESKTEETLKDSEGNETGTMKTEVKETVGKDGKSEKTEDVAVESKDGNVKTEATSKTDKNGNVKAESKTTVKSETKDVGTDAIDAALKQSEQALSNISADKTEVTKTVEVEVSSGTSAALSPEAVKKVSDYGAGLKVSGSEGSIDTDSDVLKNLAKDGKSVELSMEANNKDILKEKQKDIVGDNHFIDLNALVGGENVHQLGGKAVITFGYQLKDGESFADLKVFYVDDEGNKTLIDAAFANGSFTITVDHFSVYMVENTAAPAPVDPEVPEKDKDEGGISPVLIAGIVIVIIAAIVGVALYTRKN